MANQHETVVAALRTLLDTVVAGSNGAVFTPEVWRTSFIEEADLDVTKAAIILMRPGVERRKPKDGCTVESRLELFLLLAVRFEQASERPGETSPVRWQNAADLVGDVTQKLWSDYTLGGAAIDVLHEGVQIDYGLFMEKWSLASMRIVPRFQYESSGR